MTKDVIKLDPKRVAAVLEAATTQDEAIYGVYKLVFPDWEWIKKLDGWPSCNENTASRLMKMFMDWDNKHLTTYGKDAVMAGGGWMNMGFSARGAKDLKDWQVRLCGYTTSDDAVITAQDAAKKNIVTTEAN